MSMPKNEHINAVNKLLLEQYAFSRDIAIRNRIVELNINLVRGIAHKFTDKCKEPFDDLVQVGVMGLIRAIERYDVERGTCLSSLATPFIRGTIMHWQRDKSKLIRIPCKEYEQYQKIRNICKAESIPYIKAAEHFRYSKLEAEKLRHCIQQHFLPINETKEKIEEDTQVELLKEAMLIIPENMREIIHSYYYDDEPKKKIAKKRKITVSELNIMLDTATETLRDIVEQLSVENR